MHQKGIMVVVVVGVGVARHPQMVETLLPTRLLSSNGVGYDYTIDVCKVVARRSRPCSGISRFLSATAVTVSFVCVYTVEISPFGIAGVVATNVRSRHRRIQGLKDVTRLC